MITAVDAVDDFGEWTRSMIFEGICDMRQEYAKQSATERAGCKGRQISGEKRIF